MLYLYFTINPPPTTALHHYIGTESDKGAAAFKEFVAFGKHTVLKALAKVSAYVSLNSERVDAAFQCEHAPDSYLLF